MSLLNSDDSQRGYADGLKDAEAGREKSHFKAGLSAKFAVWGTDASDSYSQSYNKAYSEGQAKKNGIYTSNANSSIERSLTRIVADTDGLKAFQSELSILQIRLKELVSTYVTDFQALDWSDQNSAMFEEQFIKNIEIVMLEIESFLIPQAQSSLQKHIDAISRTQMHKG